MQNMSIIPSLQVYFIEKYAVASSPKRDYYALRMSNNQLCLITWKISHGPHRFPVERKMSLQDFVTNVHFQNEICRIFGEETFNQVLEVTLGEKDYLQRLPPVLLMHILQHLDLVDIIHLSQASKLCRNAVKNTMQLMCMDEKYFKDIKRIKQAQKGISKIASSNTKDYALKGTMKCKWSKTDSKEPTTESSLLRKSLRPPANKSVDHIIKNTLPLKINASVANHVINSSKPNTVFSLHGSMMCIPKSNSLTSSLLSLSSIRGNNNMISMSEYNKQNKKYDAVREKNIKVDIFKSSNETKSVTSSHGKMFEVISLIPEHLTDKNVAGVSISKSLPPRNVETSLTELPQQSMKTKCITNFQSSAPSSVNGKRSNKTLMLKNKEQEVQSCGSGDRATRTSQARCMYNRESEQKKKNKGSSKKSSDTESKKSAKSEDKGIIVNAPCKKLNKMK